MPVVDTGRPPEPPDDGTLGDVLRVLRQIRTGISLTVGEDLTDTDIGIEDEDDESS